MQEPVSRDLMTLSLKGRKMGQKGLLNFFDAVKSAVRVKLCHSLTVFFIFSHLNYRYHCFRKGALSWVNFSPAKGSIRLKKSRKYLTSNQTETTILYTQKYSLLSRSGGLKNPCLEPGLVVACGCSRV